jgi:hypothetical protein
MTGSRTIDPIISGLEDSSIHKDSWLQSNKKLLVCTKVNQVIKMLGLWMMLYNQHKLKKENMNKLKIYNQKEFMLVVSLWKDANGVEMD